MMKAMPVQAVHVPIALPWAFWWNDDMIMANELGTSKAPKTPCSALATISVGALGANAHNKDVIAKPYRPIFRTRNLP